MVDLETAQREAREKATIARKAFKRKMNIVAWLLSGSLFILFLGVWYLNR